MTIKNVKFVAFHWIPDLEIEYLQDKNVQFDVENKGNDQ